MSNVKNRITMTVVCLLALVALLLGLFISQRWHLTTSLDKSQLQGTFLDKPRKVSAFALTGIDNVAFNNTSLNGHWTMMFFGFTNCASICPTTMAELGKMYRILEKKGAKNMPLVVMVSVDPERDSLSKLNHYVKAFDSHFYAARGDERSITAMTKEMGIAYTKIMPETVEDSQNYDIEHTGTIMLFNPKGELSAFFTTPHSASLLAKEYLLVS